MNNINYIVKKSQSSFFWVTQLLPKAQRNALYTFYAFCHHLEGVTRGSMSQTEKNETIKAWVEEVDNIFDKKIPQTEIGRRIYKNCMRFNIQKQEFIRIISATQIDMNKSNFRPSLQEYLEYCRNMTGAKWYVALNILGCSDNELLDEISNNIGVAIQSTTSLRNIKDDSIIGKTYIPKECLNKAGINAINPKDILIDTKLSIAREELAKIACEAFEKSQISLKKLDKKNAKLLNGFLSIYKKYFDMMQKRGWEIISPKPQLSSMAKLKIILKSFLS